jgi:predicted dehydrogenase
MNKMTRRTFIGKSATAAAAFTIVPSHVVSGLGHKAPSDKLNIAGIGVGGMGRGNLKFMKDENIVALCDVDWNYAANAFNDYPNAKKYKDWRKMLEEMDKSIDAVMIATPDHTHAVAAYQAMKQGKHVYCEKPLTHSVYESRILTLAAEKYGVATQMGNQGASGEGTRQIQEWIWAGEIGEIEQVYSWTNRPIWPQGLERPEGTDPVPDHLDWDLFLSHAPERPFNNIYHPWNWRAWWDFGTGALGDMACHIMDPIFRALLLEYPTLVEGSSTQFNTESAPLAETAHFTYPERPDVPDHIKIKMPEVKITWLDGGLLPERPAELPDGFDMNMRGGGVLFEGSKGKLMAGCYGSDPFILGKDKPNVPQTLPRVKDGDHRRDWIRACKEDKKSRVNPSSSFDFSGPFNEMVVMGVVAVRLQDLKRTLKWDGKNMKFLNISDTDKMRVVTSDSFEVKDGHPRFNTQHETMNAKAAAEEYIKRTYLNGWDKYFPNSTEEV